VINIKQFDPKSNPIVVKCTAADLLPIDKIVGFQGNLKKLSTVNQNKLISSILIHGFIAPFFLWDDGFELRVLDGTQRLKTILALQKRGWDVPLLPVVYIEADNEKDARAKLLKITSAYGEFDLDELQSWINDMDDDISESIRLVDQEIELALTPEAAETVGDEEIPEEIIPVTKLGDLWELGEHRLLCGSSTDINSVKKLIRENKVDCVFSDPPYGIDVVKSSQVGGGGETKFGKGGGGKIVDSNEYKKIIGDETIDTAKEFYELCISMDFKNIVLWGGNYYTAFIPPSRCWIIWDKEMTGNFSEAEMAWTSFSKGGIKVFKFLWNGLSREGNRIDELKSRIHPTQKPVGLFANIFERFDGFKSYFDGFLGSGSTLIACEKTNNICYGTELEPSYCDLIVIRYKTWCENNGKTPIVKLNGEVWNG